jgi:hypothetical protein
VEHLWQHPERIDGQGMLVRGGGLRQLRAGSDGTLTNLTIKINDLVKDGQVVGRSRSWAAPRKSRARSSSSIRRSATTTCRRRKTRTTIAGIPRHHRRLEGDKRTNARTAAKARDTLARQQQLQGRHRDAETVDQAERDGPASRRA